MRKNASRDAVVRRHLRLRKKISGTAERPRLNVFRSRKDVEELRHPFEKTVTVFRKKQ